MDCRKPKRFPNIPETSLGVGARQIQGMGGSKVEYVMALFGI